MSISAKPHIRVIGIDDGPFHKGRGRAYVVAVMVRLPSVLEAVGVSTVAVDGTDSTDAVVELVSRPPMDRQAQAVMIDGAALGGGNAIVPDTSGTSPFRGGGPRHRRLREWGWGGVRDKKKKKKKEKEGGKKTP